MVSACSSGMSSSLVCSTKADCEKVYFSLHHCIQLSCLLTLDSFSLPALLFSHASFSSFPSTTFCPHLDSFLHQSQFILFPSVSHLSLSSLSIPLLSIAFACFDLDPYSLIPARASYLLAQSKPDFSSHNM